MDNAADDHAAHYQEVIIAVYRYIALLRNQPPDKRAFDEIKALSDIEFRFYEPTHGSEYASEIAKGLQAPVPREVAISGRWLLNRFDASAIVEALERLDIRHGNVAVTAKVMPPAVGPLDQTEPVYGTRYRKDKMPAEIIAALEGNPIPELFLPGPNRFIPKNFDVRKIEVAEVGRNLSSDEFRLILPSPSHAPMSCESPPVRDYGTNRTTHSGCRKPTSSSLFNRTYRNLTWTPADRP